MERKIYLEDIPLDQAWGAFTAALQSENLWQTFPAETIPLTEANGRITAQAVWAKLSSPHYHASAMDGYALRANDTIGASETQPLSFAVGEWDDIPANVRPAQAVNTGQAMPPWANCVVMIEHTQSVSAGIQIRAALPPWHNVRPMGEDMVATELVLPANHRLRPVDLGALAGSGHVAVAVVRRPRVAILPTGSELLAVEAGPPAAGQIIEYNSLVLAAQVADWGGVPTRWPIVPDDPAEIATAVRQAAADHDLLLINAGSSAGSKDYTASIVQELGDLLVHGVAVRPGHPVILGLLRRKGRTAVPVIGVPGYPVSAALTGELFVQPLLARWQGQPEPQQPTLTATLTRKLSSPSGDDDFVRVAVGKVGERFLATPISRGAGVITSLVRADGLVKIPRFSEGADAGTAVTVRLYRPQAEIEHSLTGIGSHDLTLDLMAQWLAERHHIRLSSAHVGSLGGLVALRRAEAHFAGSHLLDPETGVYNVAYVQKYLPGQAVRLVTVAGREQGWIVPPGNPQGLTGWEDAARPEVQIVNRQRGAGTRVLLDYELSQRGILPPQVQGYDREEYTHLAVAAAVASGAASAGLGIRAAATALQLDFVPLAQELYQLVIPQAVWEGGMLTPLLDLLHDAAFRTAVAALPGYDVAMMGEVMPVE